MPARRVGDGPKQRSQAPRVGMASFLRRPCTPAPRVKSPGPVVSLAPTPRADSRKVQNPTSIRRQCLENSRHHRGTDTVSEQMDTFTTRSAWKHTAIGESHRSLQLWYLQHAHCRNATRRLDKSESVHSRNGAKWSIQGSPPTCSISTVVNEQEARTSPKRIESSVCSLHRSGGAAGASRIEAAVRLLPVRFFETS